MKGEPFLMNYSVNDILHGFKIDRVRQSQELNGTMIEMHHEKTGAQLAWLNNGEDNKLFCVAFKTLPEDSTGVFHILEHSVLCGSDKYPVREPFVELLKSSMNTFLNAMTFSDKTIYPVSSRNEQDFMNLTEVYLDAVFAPALLTNPNIFYQEGWHIELDENGQPLYKGVVFNEMKGAMSDVDEVTYQTTLDTLFPDNCYGHNSGGDPKHIPDLTYEQFVRMYKRYYHPSNARIYLDGSVPLDRVLPLIDSYLSRYERQDEAHEIPMQAPLAVTAQRYYEIGADEETNGKTMMTLAKIVAPWHDRTRIQATEILFDVLTGSNDAPLSKALLASGKCQDVRMMQDTSIAQPYMMLTLRCIQDGSEEELRELLRTTVQELLKTGLDKEALTASLNRAEFKARQLNEPAGLTRCINGLTTWLYGGDLMEPMVSDDLYAALRQMAAGDGFERLMEDLLLNESNMSIIYTLPSHTYGDETRKEEQQRLSDIVASWTESDREAMQIRNEKLFGWQQTPDTAAQLETLPVLSVSEINPEPVLIPAQETCVSGRPVIFHDLPMNGITTLHYYFSLTDYTLEELSNLSALAFLLGKLPTKQHDSLTLVQAIKRDIGDLNFRGRVVSRCAETATPMLDVSCSVLDANLESAKALVHEILTETCFDDAQRVQTLLVQYNEMLKQQILGGGHVYAMTAAAASTSAQSAVSEANGGLSSALQVKKLVESFDALYPQFRTLCERFAQETAVQSRLTLSISSNIPVDAAAILAAYPVGTTVADATAYVTNLPKKVGYKIPAQISFASLAYDYRKANMPYSGTASVIANILSLSYLWNEVRVQGGAYGAGLSISDSGRMSTYSYRDPSPARSLGIYRKLSIGLRDFVYGEETLNKYIISTVASQEPPLGASTQAVVSDLQILSGQTAETQRKVRAEMLATDNDALLRWCDTLDAMAKDGSICVIGHEEALKACADENLTLL